MLGHVVKDVTMWRRNWQCVGSCSERRSHVAKEQAMCCVGSCSERCNHVAKEQAMQRKHICGLEFNHVVKALVNQLLSNCTKPRFFVGLLRSCYRQNLT